MGPQACAVGLENTLLPVKKPHTNDYRMIQDLWEVNKRVIDIHPTVPNPYSLLIAPRPAIVYCSGPKRCLF